MVIVGNKGLRPYDPRACCKIDFSRKLFWRLVWIGPSTSVISEDVVRAELKPTELPILDNLLR